MKTQLLSVTCLILLTACATVQAPATPSGRAEVTIPSTTAAKAKSALVNLMLNAKFRVSKDTDYEMDFEAPVQNLAVAVLLGSQYDPVPVQRAAFTFAEIGGATRVVADIAVITNAGSAFEKRTADNNGQDAAVMQATLDELQLSLDPNSSEARAAAKGNVMGANLAPAAIARARGIDAKTAALGLYVINITPGSPADRAGLMVGDSITTMNGTQTLTSPEASDVLAAAPAGGTVSLSVVRAGQPMTVAMSLRKK